MDALFTGTFSPVSVDGHRMAAVHIFLPMNKYRNRHTRIDGIRFDSQAEARRYVELKALATAGRIENLERQETFDLLVNDKKIGQYKADFSYEIDGQRIVEDVKGMKTPVYRLKKKHVEAQYDIKISEVAVR